MDLAPLATELSMDFADLYLEIGETRVWAPPVPVDVGLLCIELYPDEVDGDNHYKVMGEHLGLRPLITFEWQEDNTAAFRSTIDLFTLEDRTYVTVSPDAAADQEWEAFAAFENFSDEALAPFFIDLMRDNGTRLGLDLMSTLPTWVETKLLAPITIMMGWRAYLDWDEGRSRGAWEAAAEYLPSDLQRFPRLVTAARDVTTSGAKAAREEFLASYVAATYDGLVRRR
jgi:hypothetical protein